MVVKKNFKLAMKFLESNLVEALIFEVSHMIKIIFFFFVLHNKTEY